MSSVLTPAREGDAVPRRLSVEEFLALPEGEGVTLEYIDGDVVERPMTTRTPAHSRAVTHIGRILGNWLAENLELGGDIGSGEVRCRITRDPDLIVGLDVAYFDDTVLERLDDDDRFFDGPPVIAVEVVSPSDTHGRIVSRIRELVDAGVKQVWVADPDLLTLTIHRSEGPPSFFHRDDVVNAEPELPGFQVPAEMLFHSQLRRNTPRES